MSQTSRTLPPEYNPTTIIDLAKSKALALWLNLAGLVLMLVVFWLCGLFLNAVRPGPDLALEGTITLDTLWVVLQIFGIIMAMLIVHEAIHGIFFWVFTKSRPHFGMGLSYAFAAAPDWYISKLQYAWIGLSPLVLIDLAGLLVMAVGPAAWVFPAVLVVAFNSGGAVGDLWIMARLLLGCSAAALVNDSGHAVVFYEPAK